MAEIQEQTIARRRPNYLYSIISVALVLFLLGFFGLLLLHAQRLVDTFKERVNILIELEDGSSREEIAELEAFLAGEDFIKAGSVVYTSKEEAARMMSEDFGEDFLKLDLPNPLYDVLSFNVKADYMSGDSLAAIRDRIKMKSQVADVFYQESLVEEIAKNVGKIGWITLGVGLFFIIVTATLIHNTIRLALYANRFLIKNMELVGASWEFISRPYLRKALQHGLISGLISIGALLLLVFWARHELPELKSIQDMSGFIVLFLFLVLLGILINFLSTYYVVKKYLKMRVDDLY